MECIFGGHLLDCFFHSGCDRPGKRKGYVSYAHPDDLTVRVLFLELSDALGDVGEKVCFFYVEEMCVELDVHGLYLLILKFFEHFNTAGEQ